jgi:hypothetical protein
MLSLLEVLDELFEYSSRLNFAAGFVGIGKVETVVRDIDAFPGVDDDVVVEPSVKFTVRSRTFIIRGFCRIVPMLRNEELSPLEAVEVPYEIVSAPLICLLGLPLP